MSIKLYDDAVLNKFNSWTHDTDCHIYGPDDTRRLFEVIASDTNDSPIQLPIICIRRRGGYSITNPNKTVLSFDAMNADKTIERTLTLNAIPIDIEYQLDIYSRYKEEADEYMRELVFNIINNPTLKVEIPYNDLNFVHNATIRIASDIEDNSDIPERLISGQFTRLTADINIDDAYLWDVKKRLNKSIVSVYVQTEDNEPELVKELTE